MMHSFEVPVTGHLFRSRHHALLIHNEITGCKKKNYIPNGLMYFF